MTDNLTPVTVVGLGAMGSALARAFLDAGHPTTVWNRTTARSAPLAAAGAAVESRIEDAVRANPLIISCLTTFDATREALAPAGSVLPGHDLVTLNTGTPAGARAMAGWAAAHGARYLAGAVKNVPSAVGGAATQLYYSGDRTIFDDHRATLEVLGGDTSHLGAEIDLAALYELAVGGTLLPALVGFFQGAALVTSRGITASAIVPHTVKWLEMIGSVLPDLAREIDTGDYRDPASSLGMIYAGAAHDAEIGVEGNLDVSWQAPIHDLLRRAVAEGYGDLSISALVEMLRKPAPAA